MLSSRMRVIYHNWSAIKQRPDPQSVAEISHYSVLSGGRIRQWQYQAALANCHVWRFSPPACQWQPSFVGLAVQCWRALEAMGELHFSHRQTKQYSSPVFTVTEDDVGSQQASNNGEEWRTAKDRQRWSSATTIATIDHDGGGRWQQRSSTTDTYEVCRTRLFVCWPSSLKLATMIYVEHQR